MHVLLILIALLASTVQTVWADPIRIDTVLTNEFDTDSVLILIPDGYDPLHPPAIVVWWHGLSGHQNEIEVSGMAPFVMARGWIGACHMGPNDRHWNTRIAQADCETMLDWVMEHFPFSRDSIYMVGSSMGAAGGLVWHNNNCGSSDYLIAAEAGGSPILDCELRQHQYLDAGHINLSMTVAFGGVPDSTDSIDFEYHRYSAIHFADTTQSMHYNGLHLPAYATWGISDGSYLAEWVAYGRPSQRWDTLRQFGNADCTLAFCSEINGHGFQVMNEESILVWFAGFSVNRYPNDLSINADESDDYYWTRVTLADTAHTFGRYGAYYDWPERRLDINLVRNVAEIDIQFAFPWWDYDSLTGHWVNRDSTAIPTVTLRFTGLPTPVLAVRRNGANLPFTYASGVLEMAMPPSGDYTVVFDPLRVRQPVAQPQDLRLVEAYPNPFNSQFALRIESAMTRRQDVQLYDVTGRLARSLTVELRPGMQQIFLSGEALASGVYFIALPESHVKPIKVVLLK